MDERDNAQDPEWLEEFQTLADQQLGEGSACAQIHPIIEQWLEELLEGDPPHSRESVWQAMACLTTEVFYKVTPDNILDVMQEHFDEEEVSTWLESVLLIGRAFQMALDSGRLDDL